MSAPRFLIVDGYTKGGRVALQNGGVALAGHLYRDMLLSYRPQAAWEIVYPADADSQLADLDSYDGVLWTGSSLTIYDDRPEVARQIELAREGFRRGLSAFGSCWALQIAVTAAGGVCRRNPKGQEFGISRELQLSESGATHPLLKNRSEPFTAFTSHFDEVATLPTDTPPLLGNQTSHIQGADIAQGVGRFFAVQYHPEFDFGIIAALANMRRRQLAEYGPFDNEAALDSFITDCRCLHHRIDDRAAQQRLAADDELLSPALRHNEFKNWLDLYFPA